MKYSVKINLPAGLRGMDLLDTPIWNKGTAFDDPERVALGLHGLLPPHVESLQEQSTRAYEAFKAKTNDLERHIYLRQLQDTNETLFYRLMLDHVEENDADRLHADGRPGVSAVQSYLPPASWACRFLPFARLDY